MKPSNLKQVPEAKETQLEMPQETKLLDSKPKETEKTNVQPDQTPALTFVPNETKQLTETPEATPRKEEMPSDVNEENCVYVNGKRIEIKPTKLKYFRNKAASAYGIIKTVPIHELLTYGKGILDEKRDADQLLFDFLVAAFDDSSFVMHNYDDLDADTIERIIQIFGRINHIDEKQEALRKNREAQGTR